MSSLVEPRPQTQLAQESANVGATGQEAASKALIGGIGYDWLIGLMGMVFVGGAFLDGWAHNHDKVDQSFFTPWHAFLYSGFLVMAVLLLGAQWLNYRRGAIWSRALPTGYSLSILGVLIFAVGGVGDLLWHEIFGIEKAFDALFSPTHLTLAIGMNLIITGPLRAAWVRSSKRLGWRMAGPALLSLTALICGLTFITMASHPLVSSIGNAARGYSNQTGQIAGTTSILLTTILLIGPTLLVSRRWQLPVGSLVLVWGINTLAMLIVDWHRTDQMWQALAMFVAIVMIEMIRLRLEPLMEKSGAFHLFAALAPFLLMGGYFIALIFTSGSTWTVHMLTGIVVEAGIAGWLLSILIWPPAAPSGAIDSH